MERKILAAVDSSIYSHHVIHYLSRLFAGCEEVAIHLFSVVPTSAGPAAKEWLEEEELINMLSPETKRRHAAAQHYMSEAALQLARAGIEPRQVTTTVRLSRISIADDLLQEARNGLYDALLLGRRGLGKLEGILLGSVSASILDRCHDVPLWLVDGRVDSRKFLVPVDGSRHTLKAVDHLAFILQDNPHAEVTLFHSSALLASKPADEVENCHEEWGSEWCELHLSRPDSHFHGPEQILLENGFSAAKIHRLHATKGIHPSRQIVRQALIDGFGTIVMGRHPPGKKKGWLGSVSHKVLANTADTAIWLVS